MEQTHPERPGVVTLLAVLNFIGGGFGLIGAVLMAVLPMAQASSNSMPLPVLMGVAAGMAAVSALYLICGYGLWTLKSYGRTITLVLSFIGLLGFPIGTVISALILFYMFKPEVKALFAAA